MYTYLVKDDNSVEVFVDGQDAPLLRQPTYPNGEKFDSNEEAEVWAKLYLASLTDENAPYPPLGKDIPGNPKPTKAEQLEKLKKIAEGFDEDSIPEKLLSDIASLEAQL